MRLAQGAFGLNPCQSRTVQKLPIKDVAASCRKQSRGCGVRCGTSVARSNGVEATDTYSDAPAQLTMAAPGQSRLVANADGKLASFMEEHRIRGSEVGPDAQSTIITIANLLQEVASNHIVSLFGRSKEGFATDPLMDRLGLIFAMTRLQIRMQKYPKWGDMVGVETWASGLGPVRTRRDWVVWDCNTNERLGAATSTWVLVNTNTRRLEKFPEELVKKWSPFVNLNAANIRHAIDPAYTGEKLPDFDYPAEITGRDQVARRADMDMNGHINNVAYLSWLLETVPKEVFYGGQLSEITLDFKSECKAGDTVESLAQRLAAGDEQGGNGVAQQQEKHQLLHTLRRCDENGCRELVRARTLWTRI